MSAHLMPLFTLAGQFRVCYPTFTALRCEWDYCRGYLLTTEEETYAKRTPLLRNKQRVADPGVFHGGRLCSNVSYVFCEVSL